MQRLVQVFNLIMLISAQLGNEVCQWQCPFKARSNMEVHFPTWWGAQRWSGREAGGGRGVKCTPQSHLCPEVSDLQCQICPVQRHITELPVPHWGKITARSTSIIQCSLWSQRPFQLWINSCIILLYWLGPWQTNSGKKCSMIQNVAMPPGRSAAEVARFSLSDFKSTDFYLLLYFPMVYSVSFCLEQLEDLYEISM